MFKTELPIKEKFLQLNEKLLQLKEKLPELHAKFKQLTAKLPRCRICFTVKTWLKASRKYVFLYLASALYTFYLLQVTVSRGEIWGLALFLFGLFLFGVYLMAAGIIEGEK